MAYQTINPYTEELIKTFRENTDAQLELIIGKPEAAYAKTSPRKLQVDEGVAFIENAALVLFCGEPWNFPYYPLAGVAEPNLMAAKLIVKHAPICRSARWHLGSDRRIYKRLSLERAGCPGDRG